MARSRAEEPAGGTAGEPYFFVHVMKTAGSTFRQHVRANFPADRRYPDDTVDDDLLMAKLSIPTLLSLPPERRERIAIYTGHFPFFVASMVGRPVRTLALLRDPVERTVSHLKQEQAQDPAARPLEALYEDPEVRLRVHEHQVKMFAFGPGDVHENFAEPFVIDPERLDRACANVGQVDVVGRQDRFDAFLDRVVERYGWVRAPVERIRVGSAEPVSSTLRRRIAEDSPSDLAFFEHAAGLAA
jgi:hypothetical protein